MISSTPSFSSGGDGGSSFGLDNTSFGIVTNSTSRRNRLNFSALHQSSNAFTVDSSLSLGLGGNRKNNKKTAKEVKKMLPVPSVLIQPELISKEYKEQRGITLLRGHLEQHWLHIYDYLRPSYSKRIGLKSSCRLSTILNTHVI